MLLHVPKTGHVLLHASKIKRVPIPCGLQTAGNNTNIYNFDSTIKTNEIYHFEKRLTVKI
jgi:hypothetical protein